MYYIFISLLRIRWEGGVEMYLLALCTSLCTSTLHVTIGSNEVWSEAISLIRLGDMLQ